MIIYIYIHSSIFTFVHMSGHFTIYLYTYLPILFIFSYYPLFPSALFILLILLYQLISSVYSYKPSLPHHLSPLYLYLHSWLPTASGLYFQFFFYFWKNTFIHFFFLFTLVLSFPYSIKCLFDFCKYILIFSLFSVALNHLHIALSYLLFSLYLIASSRLFLSQPFDSS